MIEKDITVLARGWDHPAWNDWYPEDMPADWRLGFYASSCANVLVPAEVLLSQSEPADWLDDVHDGFRFWLEIDCHCVAYFADDADRFMQHVGTLEQQVAGIVDRRAATGEKDPWLLASQQCEWQYCDGRQPWRPDTPDTGPAQLGLIESAPRDNRQLAAWVQAFLHVQSGHGLLCFAGYAGSWQHLQDADVIADLC